MNQTNILLVKLSITEEKSVTPFVQNSKSEKPFIIYEYIHLEYNFKKQMRNINLRKGVTSGLHG